MADPPRVALRKRLLQSILGPSAFFFFLFFFQHVGARRRLPMRPVRKVREGVPRRRDQLDAARLSPSAFAVGMLR